MKKRLLSLFAICSVAFVMLLGCENNVLQPDKEEQISEAVADASKDTDLSEKKVGICIYQFSDKFMTLFRNELESYLLEKGFSKENIFIIDGLNNQTLQTNQIKGFIEEGVDVLIINPVYSSSASEITDIVSSAGIPLIYINREPDEAEEARWSDNNWNITYVGCDARQSGAIQGDIIVSLGFDTVDINGDGKIQYIMIEGDPENIDAQYRTEYSVKALADAGWEVEELDSQVGNWDKETSRQLVAKALLAHPETEVVFCNNDAMALGALESINEAERKVGEDIYLVGVDGLEEVLQNVMDGTITGTVFNDYISQAHSAADAAIGFIKGESIDFYIGCDYVKVTGDNAQSVLDLIK